MKRNNIIKLFLSSFLMMSVAAVAGIIKTSKSSVETKADASDDAVYCIVGNFYGGEDSSSAYTSLGQWKTNYDDTQKALAGVQNHKSKIYTFSGGWFDKGSTDWPYYADNFKFFDISHGWSDELSYANLEGTAKSYFKAGTGNESTNIIVNDNPVNGGFKMNFSVRPDVTQDSRKLTIDLVYYYVGSAPSWGWSPSASNQYLVDNGDKVEMTFNVGDEFKFTNYDQNAGRGNRWINVLQYQNLAGTAAGCFEEGNDSGNIKCKYDGKYIVYVKDGVLTIDYPVVNDYCYHGNNANGDKVDGWAEYTGNNNDHVITIDGDPVEFTFAAGEHFKLAPKGISYWGPLELNFTNIKGSTETITETGINYKYYRCFQQGTGNDNNNIICRKTGNYLVSLDSDLKITIVASNESQTNRIYVLDLNGNLLNNTHNAYYFNNDYSPALSTQWPGIEMTKLSGTKNIYYIDIWVEMTGVLFDNNETVTIDHSITAHVGKCLILTWAYSEGKWSSNDWVSLAAAEFIDSYMKFETDHQDNSGSGKCTSQGWYEDAKEAYAGLSSTIKEDICSVSIVVERLVAWAAANHESFTITNNTGVFAATRNAVFIQASNSPYVIIIIVTVSITLLGLVLFTKRYRKEHR